ncbi:MAG: shikimate dehydrogenase [Chloroflexota bacterium]
MMRLGLIGYPLGHSLSPKIHTAALHACGLDGEYLLFPIHPGDKQGLGDLLSRVRSGEVTGLNVTIPYKQNVIEFMDELTPTAAAIGAVNIIYMHDNKLIGDNTDAAGFLLDLKKYLTTETRGHGDLNALVLGAGGSARAIVHVLASEGCSVTIAARRIEQSQELAVNFENVKAIEFNFTTFQLSNFQLIVNTTPVGMLPNIDQSPLPENVTLPRDIVIYDLVYNPPETKLVCDARAQGLQATTGLGMLIEQAALAFEVWTGYKPPRDILWNAIEN